MRVRLPLALILAAVVTGAAAAPGEAVSPGIAGLRNGPIVGMSDNRPETITDPRFRASGIRRVRVLVPFDSVARGGGWRQTQDTWFATARANGIEPLVTFDRSSGRKWLLPSPAEFRSHVRAFRARYPWVRQFSTWSEANFPAAQPTGNNPRRAADFYRILRQECRGCNVLTPDFRADGSGHSERWLRTFKRHMGPGPHRWGLVAHPDVNRFSTARTQWFLKNTRGSVWVTEIGAIHFFGSGLRPNIARQTKAMRYMMSTFPRVSHRIDRMYVYHWRAARGDNLWDSGLLSVAGTRRPAYFAFFRALGMPAP